MRDEDSLLPSHLRGAEHLTAFEKIWTDRVESINTAELMMYLVDACNSKALPFLADQFGIITLRSWKLAANDAERREQIKNAIANRSVIGTVSAVKAAITSLGFDASHLVERSGSDPVSGWAEFKMLFTEDELTVTDPDLFLLLTQLIEDTKPARCKYMGLDYVLDGFEDTLTISDAVVIAAVAPQADTIDVHNVIHDGTYLRDGSTRRRRGVESIQFQII